MYLGGQEPGMLGKGQPYWKWKQSMGMESSLQTAASQEGLQIWRVEKMKLVSVPRKDYGSFFTGDAYLVLHSQDEERHLHIWHGEKASIDEKGASALFATQLDTTLGGKPIQHREVQGNESDTFMGYFPSGIRYQEGGVESGFQNVSEVQALSVRHLYHVKGKRNVRVWEVETSWGSFNTGDCFILDLGQTIYQWCGSQANIHEKQKAMEFANSIRDLERRGKAQVVMVTDGEEPEGMMEVLGPKPSLKEGSAQGDAQADVTHSQMASLSKVSDATGSMTLTQVSAQNPFPKTMLQSEDCFVLDNGVCGKIYVWKGRGANSEEKRAALKVAEAVISQRHYPANTQVEIIPEGLESAFFKQFFKGWN